MLDVSSHVMGVFSRFCAGVALWVWAGQARNAVVFERLTHSLSIKRIDGDQVAMRLKATIV